MPSEVASRELRNNTRTVLDRVAGGEAITITVDGKPVARLEPVERRPRWIRSADLVIRMVQADPALSAELRSIAGDTTDDEPLR